MKFFGAVIIFLLAFLAVIVMIVFLFARRLILRFRQYITGDYDDETVRRMSDKYYRGDGDGPQFDKDYFKGSGHHGQYRPNGQQQQQQQKQQRRTTTSEGVTIIDERGHEKSQRKIFEKDEGEYVDFVEEN
jgi:hypothetical protein